MKMKHGVSHTGSLRYRSYKKIDSRVLKVVFEKPTKDTILLITACYED